MKLLHAQIIAVLSTLLVAQAAPQSAPDTKVVVAEKAVRALTSNKAMSAASTSHELTSLLKVGTNS